jgi:hypothetical protein
MLRQKDTDIAEYYTYCETKMSDFHSIPNQILYGP